MKQFIHYVSTLVALYFLATVVIYAQVPLTSSGSGNNFIIQYPANITTVPTGFSFTFFSNQNITGTSGATIVLNGNLLRPLYKNLNQNVEVGDILIDQAVTVIYDKNGNWQLLSKDASTTPASAFLWTVSGVNTYNNPLSNKIGIGTSTPQSTLDVNGILNLPLGTIGGITLNTQKWLWGDNNANLVLGQSAANNNISGSYNVIIGNSAASNISSGYNNVFVGSSAGNSNTTGQYNTFIGNAAGQSNVNGFYNIALGANSYVGSGQINSIAIGQNASVFGSNMLALGGTETYAVNVGIGTGFPQNTLDVVGGARIRNLSTSGAVFATIDGDLYTSALGGVLGSGVQNGVTFWSNANTLTADGNNFFWDAQNSKLRIGTSGYGDGNARVHIYDDRIGSGGGLVENLRLTAGGTLVGDGPMINFQSAYGGFTPTLYQDWINAAIGSPYSGSYQGDLTFYTNNGTVFTGSIASVPGMEKMRITSLGNVGIGTDVPTNKLDVNGGARIRNLSISGAVFSNSNGDLYIGSSGISGSGVSNGVAFWSNSSTLTANGNYFVWDNINSKLRIGTAGYGNGNPRVHIYDDRITSGGGLVEIMRLSAGGTSFGDGPLINFQSAFGGSTPGSYPDWINAAIGSPYSGSYQGDLTFYTNNGLLFSGSIASVPGMERMRITSQGNIGIGTTTPGLAALQVEKMVGNTVAIFKNAGNSAGISLATDWPGLFFNAYYSGGNRSMSTNPFAGVINFEPSVGNVIISSGPTGGVANSIIAFSEKMRIQNNGNVGIGTLSPTAKLEVGGDVKISGDYYFTGNSSSSAGEQLIFGTSGFYIGCNDHFVPSSNNSHDLGTSALRWRTIFLINNPNVFSDYRLKTDIKNLKYGLSEVIKLKPVNYFLKDDKERVEKIGFIAQDVQKIIPEIVKVNKDSLGLMSITYSDLIPVLTKAIQEQELNFQEYKTSLEKTITDLKKQNSNLTHSYKIAEAELTNLKNQILQIKSQINTLGIKAEAK